MLGHETVTDKFYAYKWGNKSHTIIERVLLSEFVVSGSQAFHIPREKVDHSKDPRQRQLSGVNGVPSKPLGDDYSS